jgi:hypothetical protein
LQKPPAKELEASGDHLSDALRNIAGLFDWDTFFVPIGDGREPDGRAVLFAILGGAVLSVVIKLLQFYVPQRNSSTEIQQSR